MFNKLMIGLFGVVVLVFMGQFIKSERLTKQLNQANQALDVQLSENAKLIRVFESKMAQNKAVSDGIMKQLRDQIDIESKRAQAEKLAARRALKDHASITDKYNETVKKLGLILNEKNNACVDDTLPGSVLEWLQTLSHQSRIY